MTSLFISYSRKDIEVARKLTDAFKCQDLDFWIDWEGIPPTVEWWKEIESGIETADSFLFLISPDSAKSKVCKEEIEHAKKNGKRMIPVLVRDIKAEEAPTELQPLNWIFLRESDDFSASFNKLITAIKTDYEWAQTHRELQVKALEWGRNKRENSFLLHDKELANAEIQLATNSSKEPFPTDLQREYVLISRQTADRQRRNRLRITTVVAIALAGLAIFGFVQARLATERANIATARNAAIQSINLRDKQLDVALLLGIEASKRLDNFETRSVLFDNLRFSPRLLQFANESSTEDSCSTLNSQAANPETISTAISPDCRFVVYGETSGKINVWETDSQQLFLDVQASSSYLPIAGVAFSRDGQKLVSGTEDGEVNIWDLENQELLAGPFYVDESITSISLSNDENYIAVGLYVGNQIGIYPSDFDPSFIPPYLFTQHTDVINAIAFSPDDNFVASGGEDGKVMLWELQQQPDSIEPIVLVGHNDAVTSLKFSNDGKTLRSTSGNGTQIVWAVETKDPIEQTFFTLDTIGDVGISPDGKILAYEGGMPRQIVLFDIETLRATPITSALDLFLTSASVEQPYDTNTIPTHDQLLAFDSSNNLLTYNDATGAFNLWDSVTSELLTHSLPIQTGVTVAEYSDGKGLIAIGDEQGNIYIWNAEENEELGTLSDHSGKILKLHFAENLLISSGQDDKIILWDLETLKPVNSITGCNGTIDVSPDGKVLAYGNAEGIPVLFDLSKQAVMRQLEGHREVHSLSFNGDGSMLVSGGFDSSRNIDNPDYINIMLWDTRSGQQIGQTIDGIKAIFSPDDKTLFVFDEFGQFTIWNIGLNLWMEKICNIAARNFTKEEWIRFFPGERYRKTCEQWPEGK